MSSHSLFFSSSLLPSSSIPLSLPSKITPFKTTITSCIQQSKPTTNTSTSTSNGDATLNLIRAPTPPWMTSPLLLPPHQLLDLSHSKPKPKTQKKTHQTLTQSIRGGRNRYAMKRIVEGISKLKEIEKQEDPVEEQEEMAVHGKNVPWVRAEEKAMVFRREKKERVVTAAERVLNAEELGRLRVKARGMRRWVKAKKAGVTGEVVDEIVKRWREEELVMVKLVEPLKRNLDRAREILEVIF